MTGLRRSRARACSVSSAARSATRNARWAPSGLESATSSWSSSGGWAVLDGQQLQGAQHRHVAITIRAAAPEEVLELLARIHRLTPATIHGTIRPADVVRPAGQGLAAGEFDELVSAIFAGVTYANVHSATFPGGEIRAQLHVRGD
jgi:CHRD domain